MLDCSLIWVSLWKVFCLLLLFTILNLSCSITNDVFWDVYILFLDVTLRILPTLFIVPINIYMFFKIRRIQKSRENIKLSVSINATLLLIVLTHMILTIPYNIMGIILSAPFFYTNYFQSNPYVDMDTVFAITYIMKLFSHAINHFLYCFTNQEIREETMQSFICLKKIVFRD